VQLNGIYFRKQVNFIIIRDFWALIFVFIKDKWVTNQPVGNEKMATIAKIYQMVQCHF